MGEPKAFASLSSGLLARKGAARPAMRPQGFGQVGGGLEDLGWNDMGFEAPRPADSAGRDVDHDAFGQEVKEPPLRNPLSGLTPVSPVHSQQAEIANRFASHDEDGEDENGDYIDETAELFDPDADDMPVTADEEEFEEAEEAEDSGHSHFAEYSRQSEHVEEPEYSWQSEHVEESRQSSENPAPVLAVPVRHVAPVASRTSLPRAAPGSKGKAAFTLRLDPARHLKLRLACAVMGSSAQQLVTDAIDQLLDEMPELDSMAERAPAAAKRA